MKQPEIEPIRMDLTPEEVDTMRMSVLASVYGESLHKILQDEDLCESLVKLIGQIQWIRKAQRGDSNKVVRCDLCGRDIWPDAWPEFAVVGLIDVDMPNNPFLAAVCLDREACALRAAVRT